MSVGGCTPKPPPPASPPNDEISSEHVHMPREKYEDLASKYGPYIVRQYIAKMNEYARQSQINAKKVKKYGCHAEVIEKWIIEDFGLDKTNPQRYKPDVKW